MQTNVRLRLDMAGRALEFCHTHPDQEPATVTVVTRLTDLIGRADTLSRLARASVTTAAAAVDNKSKLRLAIEEDLSALFGIAQVASVDHPEIAVHRRRIRSQANEVTLMTVARVALAESLTVKDRLVPFGLNDTLLASLSAGIEEYSAELARQRNAIATQVGAGADLKAVTVDIMAVIKNLDALHIIRFKQDRELKAAWKSARNVAWRIAVPDSTAITPTPLATTSSNAA